MAIRAEKLLRRTSCAPLSFGILHIVGARTNKNMIRVDASWVIAMVTSVKPLGHLNALKHQREM